MWINTLSFIYVFLPFSLIFYYACPQKIRSAALLAISAAFIYLSDPQLLYLAAVIVLPDFMLIKASGLIKSKKAKQSFGNVFIAISVVKNLSVIVFYYKDKIDKILPLPFIITCIAIASCEAVYDYIKTETQHELKPGEFALATMFYPKLIMGPVVTVYDFCQKLKTPQPALENVGQGIVLFIIGMAKKILLADTAYDIYMQVLKLTQKNYTWVSILFAAICIMFYIVFTFMAFSDIARGLAMVYSLKLPINTFYPLDSDGVWQFVKRLNLSCYNMLSKYLPGGGRAKWNLRLGFIAAVIFSAAYFMGVRTSTLCWAVAVFVIVAAEEFLFRFKAGKKYLFIKKLLTWFFLVFSFAFFAGENFSGSVYFIKSLLFINQLPVINDKTLYIIISNWVFILLFVLFLGCFWSAQLKKIKKKIPALYTVAESLVAFVLLFLITITLV